MSVDPYEIVDDGSLSLDDVCDGTERQHSVDAKSSVDSKLYRKHGCPSCAREQTCWCAQMPYSLLHVPHYPAGRDTVHTLKSPPIPFQVSRLLVFGHIELSFLEVEGHEISAWLHRPRTQELQALTVRARQERPPSHPGLEHAERLVPLQLLPHTCIRLGIRNEHTQPEDWGASLIGATAIPAGALR